MFTRFRTWWKVYATWYVSVAGVMLCLGLYLLPRHVLEGTETVPQKEGSGSLVPMHTLPMSIDARMEITRWRSFWQQDKQWQWADSLAYLYLQYERMDSALLYIRRLTQSDQRAAQRRAGLHLYRAYTLSQDTSTWQVLAVQARSQLAVAANLYPEDYSVQVKSALTWLRSATPMTGILRLRGLYEQVPHHPDVLFELGRLSLRTGQYEKGEEKLRKLLELYPTHVEGMLYLGRYLIQNGGIAEGQDWLERVREQSNDPAFHQLVERELRKNK